VGQLLTLPFPQAGERLLLFWVNDGARTRDNRNHNPGLYQLSYVHHETCSSLSFSRPTGFEPVTPGLEGRCSIRMSYGRIIFAMQRSAFGATRHPLGLLRGLKTFRGRGIRTPDILLPKQTRYQTALYPVLFTK
jgi:hypothetical protein